MSDPALVCDGVSKRYARTGRWVLHDVHFALPAGSLAAVVGANGSGKSTLLSVVAGVSRPNKGVIRSRPTPVAWMPDRFAAPTSMTATDYLAHMGRIRGLAPTVVANRSHHLLGCLGLLPGPDVALRSLSRGNARKVAIAQALLGPVGLLVLDEPWAGLDQEASHVLDQLIAQARHDGSVVLVSTHHVASIDNASHVLVLRDARLEPQPAGKQGLAPSPTADPRRRVKVHLSPNPGAGQLATGDLERSSEEGYLVLRVPPEAVDTLLVDAVGSGWSVKAVIPEQAPADGEA